MCAIAPFSASFAYFAAKPVTGFRPRYTNVLLSTSVGLVAIAVIGTLLTLLPITEDKLTWTGIRAISGWLTMSFCHAAIIRGPNQERISRPKALTLTMIQVVTPILCEIPCSNSLRTFVAQSPPTSPSFWCSPLRRCT